MIMWGLKIEDSGSKSWQRGRETAGRHVWRASKRTVQGRVVEDLVLIVTVFYDRVGIEDKE